MRKPFLVLLACAAVGAHAEVYRSIGPDGQVLFSDRPLPNAEQLELPGQQGEDADEEAAPAAMSSPAAAGLLGPYDALEIVSPENEHRTRDPDGELPVSLMISPALMDGHRLVIEVDSIPVQSDKPSSTQMVLRGLTLGSHRVRGIIQNESGEAVATTATLNVHVLPPLPASAQP